jgi:murein DD-endopeptidase MepM/ murein hydrolase activator NlpD
VPRGVRRAGLAALLLAVTLISPAGAQEPAERQDGSATDPGSTKRAVDEERSRLVRRYDETLALEAERTAAYQQSVQRAGQLAAEVTRLERSLAGISLLLERAETRYLAAVEAQGRLAVRLDAAREELQRGLADLRTSAVVAYVEASELGSLRGLNKAFDDQEGALAVFYASYVGDITDTRVEAVESQERHIEDLVARAEEASGEAATARGEVEAQQAEAQRVRDEARVARQQADAEAAHQAQLVAEVTAQREQYEHEMHALEQESARLGELIRERAAAAAAAEARANANDGSSARPRTKQQESPPAGNGARTGGAGGGNGGNSGGNGGSSGGNGGRGQPAPAPTPAPAPAPAPPTTNNAGSGAPPGISVSLSYPLPGWPVVSKYGWRVHPILGTRKLHEGIDIWAEAGTGIAASAGGTVVWVGPRNGYGNAVAIDHGSGVSTLYAHLSGFNVSDGQRVSRGATVGFVGQTGLAAGPHLHFEVRVNGKTFNPLAYVRAG